MKTYLLTIVFFLMCAFSINAQEKSGGKISGLIFGDYSYKITGDSSGSVGQYSPLKKDAQGFEIRRIYFRYDHTLSEKFAAQFTLESNEKTLLTGKYSFAVKTAFLEWKNLIPQSSIFIGMEPTPTFAYSESIWNYRSVEKTLIDYRIGGAVDLGVSVKGTFDKEGKYGYQFMIGNGTGQKLESNKFKKYYGELIAKPVKGLSLEAYSDFEPNAGDKNKITLKGFVAYQTNLFTIGVEAVQQTQKKAISDSVDVSPSGISGFAWVTLLKKPVQSEKIPVLNAFARFDYWDPDTKNTNAGYKENFITLGLDYMPIKDVHVIPNVWINTYSNKNSESTVKRDADIVARLTFNYIYK
jgi:hypothetical protein